jgi:hypothetical protein
MTLHGQEKAGFDGIVDFSVTLKDLAQVLASGEEDRFDEGRYLLLTGTMVDLAPRGSRFFLLTEEDVRNPTAFVSLIKEGGSSLSGFIGANLSDETAQLLKDFEPSRPLPEGLLPELIKETNNMVRRADFIGLGLFDAGSLPAELEKIGSQVLSAEETGFLNRLIMEAIFPGVIAPIQITAELVAGEWLGTEEVISYHGRIVFKGPESFKVFLRRRPRDASPLMIPPDSRVLVVAKPLEPITSQQGRLMWLLEALYIRSIQ